MPTFVERTRVGPDSNEGFIVRTTANNNQYEYHVEIVEPFPERTARLTMRKVVPEDGDVEVDEDPDPTEAVERALETKGYTLV